MNTRVSTANIHCSFGSQFIFTQNIESGWGFSEGESKAYIYPVDKIENPQENYPCISPLEMRVEGSSAGASTIGSAITKVNPHVSPQGGETFTATQC